MIQVEIDAAALAEALEAQDFNAARRPELGVEFATELDKAIVRIAAYPTVWPPFSARTRRYLMDRFPYSVVYRLSGDTARDCRLSPAPSPRLLALAATVTAPPAATPPARAD